MQSRSILAAVLTTVALSAHAEGQLSVSASYDYTSGTYGGSTTTTITTVPVTLNYLNDAWRMTVNVPWISVTGDGSVIPGPGGPLSFTSGGSYFGPGRRSTSTTTTTTNSGLGDVTADLGYTLFPESGSFYEFSLRAKFGTADPAKGLGTGENDYSLQFDAIIGQGGVSPYLTAGYYITGDTDTFTYNDVPYGSVGLMFRPGEKSSLGIGFDYRKATVEGTEDLRQASAFYGWQGQDGWTGSLSALYGLSDTAPDVGFNITLGQRF